MIKIVFYIKIIGLTFLVSSNMFLYSQGNYRREHYGNRSILLNGNVTGSVDDLGLTFYNPSRLALIDNPAFSIGGRAFELSNIKLKNAFGKGENLSQSTFNAIPSLVAGTFEVKFLPKDKFAYAFISRTNSDINFGYDTGVLEGQSNTGIPDAEKFLGRITLQDQINDEWLGGSWARKINNHFALGISGFLSIYEMNGFGSTLYTGQNIQQEVTTYNSKLSYKQNSYGLFFKVGLSYKAPKIELGLNVHLPYIDLNKLSQASFIGEEFLAGNGATNLFNFISLSNIENERKTPLGIALGMGLPIKKSKLHFNVEWYNGISKYKRISLPNFIISGNRGEPLDFDEQLKSVVNFGIGSEVYISPSVKGFMSFSSDFSAYIENTNLFDVINQNEGEINYESDYWHFAAGIDLKLKWGNFLLGTNYSKTSSNFVQPINFPTQSINPQISSGSELAISTWRIIIGIEVPFLKEKLAKLKKSNKEGNQDSE